MNARNASWQGMNWASQTKRLSIYLRDGITCQWCGKKATVRTKLTLDHVRPLTKGGTNRSYNLVTSCKKCNDSKRHLSASKFAHRICEKTRESPDAVLRRVRNAQKRSLGRYRRKAMRLIKDHRSAKKAVSWILDIERDQPNAKRSEEKGRRA